MKFKMGGMKKPKAIESLKAKYTLKSFWSEKWTKMELNSKTGFAMSRKDIRANDLDYWAMIELPTPQTIEKIILKRRGDLNQISRKFKKRIISKIRIEYFNGKKWQYYKAGALLQTGQLKSDSA
jgi:regulation of enolase protein 1 (concanavalin A-like superfamily)